jgi:hypothetical protein
VNDNNYVLLNRRYFTEGVIVMLAICYGAFDPLQTAQASVTTLDGANGREIPGIVSRSPSEIIASKRRENECKFMIILEFYSPMKIWSDS